MPLKSDRARLYVPRKIGERSLISCEDYHVDVL